MNFLIFLKSEGYRDSTREGYSKTMKHLAKHCDLDDPEQVKRFIAEKNVKDSRKEKLANDYDTYVRWKKLTWKKPIYKRDTSIQFIPLEKEIDQLIGASRGKTSTFLQFIKESGCRPIEAWGIAWEFLDSKRNKIYINNPAKHSNPRDFTPSSQLWGMIHRLPHKSEYIFREHNNSDLENFERTFYKIRKRTAVRLQNPRLKRIGFKTLRHWKGTMEYYRTRDIYHVKRVLGHKNIKNTEIYIHLAKQLGLEKDEWISKVARTLEETCKLVESGFEYVTEMDQVKIFRKRK